MKSEQEIENELALIAKQYEGATKGSASYKILYERAIALMWVLERDHIRKKTLVLRDEKFRFFEDFP